MLASVVHLLRGVKLNRLPFLTAATVAATLAAISPVACTSTTTSATAPSNSKCQVTAAAAPQQFTAAGGTGQLTITAARECAWSVDSLVGWVAVTGERSGNGSATLPFTVASNPAPAVRSADLLVDEVRLGVTQAAAACGFSLNRTSDTTHATGGTLSVDLTTLSGCNWSASSSVPWLTLSRSSGQASGRVDITVAENTGAARGARITLGGQDYTVEQAAATTTPPTPPTTPPPTSPPPTSPPPPPPPLPPTDPPGPVSLSGTVSGLSGSCPTLSFRVGGKDVATDRTTDFSGGKCRDLSNGDTVKVSGLVQSSGIVRATDVEITRNEK